MGAQPGPVPVRGVVLDFDGTLAELDARFRPAGKETP